MSSGQGSSVQSERSEAIPPTDDERVIDRRDRRTYQRTPSMALKDLSRITAIADTPSLVKAFNSEKDGFNRDTLREWLQLYPDWFSEKPPTGNTKSLLTEYINLSAVQARSSKNNELLREFIHSLYNKTVQAETAGPTFAISLAESMNKIDESVFVDTPGVLIGMANGLFELLDPAKTEFNKATQPVNGAILFALHQTVFLLHRAMPSGLDADRTYAPYQTFMKTVSSLKSCSQRNTSCYPFAYQVLLLEQSLIRLARKSSMSVSRGVWRKASGLMYLYNGLRSVLTVDVDPEAFENGCKKLRENLARNEASESMWYDHLLALSAAAAMALIQQEKIDLFKACTQSVESSVSNASKSTKKPLLFGLVSQLAVVAVQCTEAAHATWATTKLINLAMDAGSILNVYSDADVMEAIIQALHDVYQRRPNSDVLSALNDLLDNPRAEYESVIREWLGDNTLQQKLEETCLVKEEHDCDRIFKLLKQDMKLNEASEVILRQNELKNRYGGRGYSQVKSLFENNASIDVSTMKFHLVTYQDVEEMSTVELLRQGQSKDQLAENLSRQQRDYKEIAVTDLFARGKLKPKRGRSALRTVLLFGNPGSGKTSLSKKITHGWSKGEWGDQFSALYLIPVRELNVESAKRDADLEDCIARICFSRRRGDKLEKLRCEIEEDLERETTLLVIDGLDERNEEASEVISSAKECGCQILFLSRPYNLDDLREEVDAEIECHGLNDNQLTEFIESEFKQPTSEIIIAGLRLNISIWDIVHIPINLHIMCFLWKESDRDQLANLVRSNLLDMYNDMTAVLWKRYVDKSKRKEIVGDIVFTSLEEIAFEALMAGEILISQVRIARSELVSGIHNVLRDAGFLLLRYEGDKYQFPHLTFQEFFAGRYVSRSIRDGSGMRYERARRFLAEHKYVPKSRITMSFAAMDIWKHEEVSGFHKLLEIIDSDPIDLLGIQHLYARMQIVEACLSHDDCVSGCLLSKEAKALTFVRALTSLIEDLIESRSAFEFNCLLKTLQRMPNVVRTYPEIVDSVMTGQTWLMNNAGLSQNLIRVIALSLRHAAAMVAEIRDEVMSRHSPFLYSLPYFGKACSEAMQLMRDLKERAIQNYASGDENQRETAIGRIGLFIRFGVEGSSELVDTVIQGCGDSDDAVRAHAFLQIGEAILSHPKRVDELVDVLLLGYRDKNFYTRLDAFQQFGHAIQCGAARTDELIDILVEECCDGKDLMRICAFLQLGTAILSAPGRMDELVEVLLRGCSETSSEVRAAALGQVGTIFALVSGKSGELTDALLQGCRDSDMDARRNAFEQLGTAFSSIQERVEECVDVLVLGCEHDTSSTRIAAFSHLALAIRSAHGRRDELIEVLVQGCADSDGDVLRSAVSQLGAVISSVPDRRNELITALSHAFRDESDQIRSRASSSLKSVDFHKIVSAFVHVQEPDIMTLLLFKLFCEDLPLVRLSEPVSEVCYFNPSFQISTISIPGIDMHYLLSTVKQKAESRFSRLVRNGLLGACFDPTSPVQQ